MNEVGVMKTVDVGMIRRSVDTLSTRATSTSTTTSETHPAAYDEWGEDATFNYDSFTNDASGLGFEVTDKYKPLSGTLTEEGNRWSDIRVENPEDNNTFVIVRRLDAVAFAGHPKSTHKSFENPIPQIVFSFNNGSASPIYVNKKGERFAPVELNPFNTIVDVNWGGEDFVIISVIASANRVGSFGSDILFPNFTGMNLENLGNGVTRNDCPAMTVLCKGDVYHYDQAHSTYKNIPQRELEPTVDYMTGLGMINSDNAREKIHELYGIAPSMTKAYVWHKHPDHDSILCIGHLAAKSISAADNAELYGQFGIPLGGAQGQAESSTDPYSPRVFWKLKGFVEIKTDTADQGKIRHSIYWFYKKTETSYVLKYDNKPYVYFSFFIGANVLKKELSSEILNQGGGLIEFDVKVGECQVPTNADATYINEGKIRATWYRGSVFKDALTMGSMKIAGVPETPTTPGHMGTPAIPGATFDAAWLAMLDGSGYLQSDVVARLNGAIITSHEYNFPCGSDIAGPVIRRAKFQLNFAEKSADRE